MARRRLELTPANPWTLGLFNRIPLPPIWVGCGLGLSVFTLFLVVSYAFGAGVGRFDQSAAQNVWGAELILAGLIGLVPAATVYSVRGALRFLDELRPTLGCSADEFRALQRELTRYPRWLLFGIGAVSAAGALNFVFSDPTLWAGGVRPPLTDPAYLWLSLLNAVFSWLLARGIALELVFARAFSRLGERLPSIDLLDRAPLAPFGRRALRGVLVWMLLAALWSLLYIGDWAADIVAPMLVLLAAFAFSAFLFPLLGAHRRIRDVKRAELERVRDAIQACRQQVLSRPNPGELTGGRLADLIAWEGRIEATSEWPLSASTLLRFALYLAIGVGSWIGAAVVERALEASLG